MAFEGLSGKLNQVFKKLKSHGKLKGYQIYNEKGSVSFLSEAGPFLQHSLFPFADSLKRHWSFSAAFRHITILFRKISK